MCQLSVIICTHNPRLEYLKRVFESLKSQTLPVEDWELLLIDNKSLIPLAQIAQLNWHPNARIIVEENLGLTPARIKGIVEARADLLLFIDDDNCLKYDYLQIVANKFNENNLIGVLGAGLIIPEFEVQPSKDVLPFTNMLALRSETKAHYSNEINFTKAIPYGAGMAILKPIALNYVESCKNRSFAASLDRTGHALLSGGDVDMALHACMKGYLAGVIPELEIIHIIPKSRIEPGYMVKIAEGHAFSHYLLGKLWDYLPDYAENKILKKLRYISKWRNSKGLSKKIYAAEYEATERARKIWNKQHWPN